MCTYLPSAEGGKKGEESMNKRERERGGEVEGRKGKGKCSENDGEEI